MLYLAKPFKNAPPARYIRPGPGPGAAAVDIILRWQVVSFEIRIFRILRVLDELRKYWLYLGEGSWHQQFATSSNHYCKFSEKGMKCARSLYIGVHAILKATCLFLLDSRRKRQTLEVFHNPPHVALTI